MIEVKLNELDLNSKNEIHLFKEYRFENLNQSVKMIEWNEREKLLIDVENFERKNKTINLSFGVRVRNLLENCTTILSEISVNQVEIPPCESQFFL